MLRRAADEFVTAIAMFHEPGGAKPCDGGGLKVKREEREPAGSFYFHAVSMTGLVGHLLSKPKIKIRGGDQRRKQELENSPVKLPAEFAKHFG